MAGNLLGARRYFAYTSDTGETYSYLTDQNLGEAVSATLDDSNPPLPRRFKPRGVWCESANGGRKFVICPTTDNTVYDADSSQNVTIDGTVFKTTGRRGESVSFGANP